MVYGIFGFRLYLTKQRTIIKNTLLLCYNITRIEVSKYRYLSCRPRPEKIPMLKYTYVPGNVYKLADSTWTNVLTVLQVVITCLVGIRNLDRSILEILWETISSSSNMKFLRSYISTKIDA